MRRHLLTALLVVGMALVAIPALAQYEGLGLTEANGCDVFVGVGNGQIVSDWGEEPLATVGTVILDDAAGDRQYTLYYEEKLFPSVPAGENETVHAGYDNWRFEENGVRGTFRVHIVVKYDPDDPLTLGLVGEGELTGGNRYATGGVHFLGTMDYYSGAYELTLFEMVLCQRP